MKIANSASDGIVSMIDANPRMMPSERTDPVNENPENHRDHDGEHHRHGDELHVLDHALEDRRPALGVGHPGPPAGVGVGVEDQCRQFADAGEEHLEALEDVVVGGGVSDEEPPSEHEQEQRDRDPAGRMRRRCRIPSGCGVVGADSRSRTSLMVRRPLHVGAPTRSMVSAMSVLGCLPLAAVLGGLVRGDGRGRIPTASLMRGHDHTDHPGDDNSLRPPDRSQQRRQDTCPGARHRPRWRTSAQSDRGDFTCADPVQHRQFVDRRARARAREQVADGSPSPTRSHSPTTCAHAHRPR